MTRKVPVAVLISGSGTNLQALLDASEREEYPARISLVISNRRDARGLERAREAGVPALWIPHKGRTREEFENALLESLADHDVQWVALAGFMRLLSNVFLSRFAGRVLNIHPSLLPSFPGLGAQEQALRAGVRVTGATVHLVEEGTDTGPVILQGVVPVLQEDDVETLRVRILKMEHQLYPRALAWAVEGRLELDSGGRLLIELPPGESLMLR